VRTVATNRRTPPEGRWEALVSIKHRLRTVLLCLPLLLGAFGGMAMRPEEIEELMHSMNQQKITYMISDESENGDEAIPKTPDDRR
jgi:hypothetical protein